LKELNVSFLSSYVAGKMYTALQEFISANSLGWVVPEGTSFQCFPDDAKKVRRADAAFISLDRLTVAQATAEGHCTVCPDLVVEVVSPNDLAWEVNQKRTEWLAAGAKLVWIIDPEDRTIHAYKGNVSVTLFRATDTLTAEPVLAGFSCPVADLFRLPAGALPGAPPSA
jgi:Uma2 family endonuclease